MKTLKYIFAGAAIGILCAAALAAVLTAREASFMEGLPEIYESQYGGGFVKIFGLTMANGSRGVCTIQMMERDGAEENKPKKILRLKERVRGKCGLSMQMRQMPRLGEYGKYYVTCYFGEPGPQGPVILGIDDFEYATSAPEWDEMQEDGFRRPIPAEWGAGHMPPLEKNGFPIIVK